MTDLNSLLNSIISLCYYPTVSVQAEVIELPAMTHYYRQTNFFCHLTEVGG